MGTGERIDELLRQRGWSQAELARRVGISPQSIWKLVNGGAHGSRHLHKIARELGTTAEYLDCETEDTSAAHLSDSRMAYRPQRPPAPLDDPDIVEVAEIDLKFGMGATELEIPVTKTRRFFSRAWLRTYTKANPDSLYFAQGIGDSMAPTILDSDLLLIDTSEQTIRMADKVWAIAFYGQGMIKRLRNSREGVRILSDNPAVPDEFANDGELHVLGRVVGVVRKM